ncbi:BclA C-terminal domain-containing protein [Methylomicrobium album]|uniref:BclA C-terminal domain-containing protein n=1 Tax=Methylomicrobium album BG8 TaxID=686340 RepID=H8GN89_METAL|nr:hypothetical protein [Methylomicrobium album]EIC28318.1 hypothetical protein Metal_0466 [Methylomicrobium album BG8]
MALKPVGVLLSRKRPTVLNGMDYKRRPAHYVYEGVSGGDVIVGGDTDVSFSNNGPLEGIAHTTGSSVSITSTGTYKIDYKVNLTDGVGAAIAIAVNGTANQSTSVPVLAAPGQVSGTAILDLNADDIITLRNDSSATSFTLSGEAGVDAQLSVLRLD